MTLADLTDNQLIRLYHRLDARMRHGNGYQPFGYDWPTLYAVNPGLYRALRSVISEGVKRGI